MDHVAQLTGSVTLAPLGGPFAIEDGVFNLFNVAEQTGIRQIVYAFRFKAADGQTYYLHGHKEVHDDPGALDPVQDLTTLFTLIYRGDDQHAPIYAAGLLRFDLKDSSALIGSMKILGASSWWQRAAGLTAFASFAWGVLRDEHLRDVRLLYDSQYENLALTGKLTDTDGSERSFFLASGVHDRGFPWGDSGILWDVLLVVADGKGGYERYCVTDYVLEGLRLDVSTGTYRYVGRLFRLPAGCAASFSGMRKKEPAWESCQVEIDIAFEPRAYDAVVVSFPLVPNLVRRLNSKLDKELRQLLPGEHQLGVTIVPHTVRLKSGHIRLTQRGSGSARVLTLSPERTFGEAEQGSFRNIKEPTLLYGYLCALLPEDRTARVQIHSRTLRNEKEHFGKDRLDAFLGAVVERTSSSEMLMQNGTLTVRGLAPAGQPFDRARELRKVGEPIVDVRNDQFPTGVFHRRIVRVVDESGVESLALEEDMSLLRLEAVGSTQRVTVASIRDQDKRAALDAVLAATRFDEHLDAKRAASGKSQDQFLIALKPNFMFAYDKHDHSTYTDPDLVHHLVRRIRARGYTRICVVEAQSTYGEYFDRRSVPEMAEYLGYDRSAGYDVVDMTLDATESRELGPHLGYHPVSTVWRDSDYRIVFAKNKTHAYAYYTLALKCVYGALPLKDKFKEYHCKRGIYETAIEYLKAFPVDFGLIDAYSSADGPFGVFADPAPRDTRTVIGGSNLVAVDWVGASKMGIDPMLSKYMRLAVEAFGKPEINLVGDGSPYRPWLNVPAAFPLFASKAMDSNYYFGNVLYAAAAQMDETHFTHKDRSLWMRALRRWTVPLRRTFFVRTGEEPSWSNRLVCWLFYQLGF